MKEFIKRVALLELTQQHFLRDVICDLEYKEYLNDNNFMRELHEYLPIFKSIVHNINKLIGNINEEKLETKVDVSQEELNGSATFLGKAKTFMKELKESIGYINILNGEEGPKDVEEYKKFMAFFTQFDVSIREQVCKKQLGNLNDLKKTSGLGKDNLNAFCLRSAILLECYSLQELRSLFYSESPDDDQSFKMLLYSVAVFLSLNETPEVKTSFAEYNENDFIGYFKIRKTSDKFDTFEEHCKRVFDDVFENSNENIMLRFLLFKNARKKASTELLLYTFENEFLKEMLNFIDTKRKITELTSFAERNSGDETANVVKTIETGIKNILQKEIVNLSLMNKTDLNKDLKAYLDKLSVQNKTTLETTLKTYLDTLSKQNEHNIQSKLTLYIDKKDCSISRLKIDTLRTDVDDSYRDFLKGKFSNDDISVFESNCKNLLEEPFMTKFICANEHLHSLPLHTSGDDIDVEKYCKHLAVALTIYPVRQLAYMVIDSKLPKDVNIMECLSYSVALYVSNFLNLSQNERPTEEELESRLKAFDKNEDDISDAITRLSTRIFNLKVSGSYTSFEEFRKYVLSIKDILFLFNNFTLGFTHAEEVIHMLNNGLRLDNHKSQNNSENEDQHDVDDNRSDSSIDDSRSDSSDSTFTRNPQEQNTVMTKIDELLKGVDELLKPELHIQQGQTTHTDLDIFNEGNEVSKTESVTAVVIDPDEEFKW